MKHQTLVIAILALTLPTGCRNQGSSDGDADADGDAGGDAGADGDGDADDDGFTPGCYPELGICDPMAQCGCADGQACDIVISAEGESEACGENPGTGVHGAECPAEGCAPGHVCLADGICYQWCLEDEDCSARYPGSACTLELSLEGEPPTPLLPYKVCSPEDVGLGAGRADFSLCTGPAEDCPGNPPISYAIAGGEVNGRCDIDATTSPATLTFNLRQESGPLPVSLSITANALAFDLDAARAGQAEGGAGELTRFSVFIGEDIYSTRLIASPPGRGSCEALIHFREAEQGFDLEFTCNHIATAFTDDQLVTMVDDAMGPGTLSMDGCAVAL